MWIVAHNSVLLLAVYEVLNRKGPQLPVSDSIWFDAIDAGLVL